MKWLRNSRLWRELVTPRTALEYAVVVGFAVAGLIVLYALFGG